MKRYLTMASTYHMRRADVLLTIDGERWRLKIARRSSRLDHYYHFITDFVWPIYSWSTKMRPGGGIAFSDCVTLNPQPLHFRQLFHEIFGVRLRGVKLHSGVARSAFIRNTARMSGFNPRWRGYLDFFENIDAARDDLRRFNEHLDMTFARSPSRRPTLVLIEREAGNADRGASRRAIFNHDELAQSLKTFCGHHGLEFVNVKLESMAFADEARLFSRNTIVVGQHGAGLVNALWLKPATACVVELASEAESDHFLNLCSDFGIDYSRLRFPVVESAQPQDLIIVDTAAVIGLLETKLNVLTDRTRP